MVLAGACFLAITPFFWWGSASGHDFEFHMYSWMEVLGQWKHGVLYPRWAALAHWGYGEARFLFYPPASWTLGAGLGAILPWKMVPGAYCWLVLTLAGASAYQLARKWLPASDALFAAILYALNPYHLLIVYWRSAYAELLAAVLLPWLLLCLLRLKEPGPNATLELSLVLAAAWLTNAPAAVMIQYSAAALALILVMRDGFVRPSGGQGPGAEGSGDLISDYRRTWQMVLRVAAALVLGAGLASFYLLPAIYEQGWINLSQVMSPGVRPQDNFLFTTIADPDHNRFNLLISAIALVEIGVLVFAIWFSKKHSEPSSWTLLSAWGGGSAVLMFSVSELLWRHLPKLRFVQLPFRWLLCMNAALALLLALATKRWSTRLLLCALLWFAVVLAGHKLQMPWWDTAADIREMSNAIADGTGYEGTDEYVPAGADAYELNKGLARVSDSNGLPVTSEILAWEANEKHFVVHSNEPRDLMVRLFNYPAWLAVVNGKNTETRTAALTGLLLIRVDSGASDVDIRFRRTTDRVIGDIVSLISLILILAVWIWATLSARRERHTIRSK